MYEYLEHNQDNLNICCFTCRTTLQYISTIECGHNSIVEFIDKYNIKKNIFGDSNDDDGDYLYDTPPMTQLPKLKRMHTNSASAYNLDEINDDRSSKHMVVLKEIPILNSFKIVEGEINFDDPFSKIFFISDGLMTMLDDKYKIKFARHIANLADSMPNNQEVPEYFVENELRKWVNDKFILDPPIPPKTSDDKLSPIDVDNTEETITEQKLSKKELFQEIIDDKLEYIKKHCDEYNADNYPNDISFSTCDYVVILDSISVDEVVRISGARTDMEGTKYDTTPGIYLKLTINLHSATKIYDVDELIYDLKHILRNSTGLLVVFDYRINNTFTD